MPKLDRLVRSVPDARAIADELEQRDVRLQLGTTIYDPNDPMGHMFFNVLATFAGFEADLLSLRTREGMLVAKAKGRLRGKPPKLMASQQAAPDQASRGQRAHHRRTGRSVHGEPRDRLPRHSER